MRENRHVKEYHRFINEDLREDAISDLFKDAHAAIKMEDLVPISDVIGKPNMPSEDTVNNAVEYLGIDPKHLFYDPKNRIEPIFYWKDFVYYGFFGGNMDIDTLKMVRAKEYLEDKAKRIERSIQKHGLGGLIASSNKKIAIPLFIKMYEDIPDDQKYDTFVDIYTRSEYGFDMFPQEIIKDVFPRRKLSPEWRSRMVEWKKVKRDKDGKVAVYRGENRESAKEESAFSWTTDRKVAKFFADRFHGGGKVIKKSIDPDEIMDFLQDRSESEVILLPEKYK